MSMAPYPEGCGGCGGACCREVVRGEVPWNPVTKCGEKMWMGECYALLPDGRCEIELRMGHNTKPVVCRSEAYKIGGTKCVVYRKRYTASGVRR